VSTREPITPSDAGKEMSNAARAQVLIRGTIFALILALLWGFVSGHWERPMPWVFLGSWAIVGLVVPAFVVPLDESYVDDRTQIKEGVQKWDKPIVIVGSLYVPLGLVLVAALDALQAVATMLGALGYLFSVWASAVNKFYGRFVRIQKDRGHTVVTEGPYRYVRHPGYAGLAVFLLTSALSLGSLWTLIPNGLFLIAMIVRTALEDRFLRENLAGYKEYAQRTRYRLIPGIW
jgi:protein-S-isoprenylcysteine O-methyltransferase Ste14